MVSISSPRKTLIQPGGPFFALLISLNTMNAVKISINLTKTIIPQLY